MNWSNTDCAFDRFVPYFRADGREMRIKVRRKIRGFIMMMNNKFRQAGTLSYVSFLRFWFLARCISIFAYVLLLNDRHDQFFLITPQLNSKRTVTNKQDCYRKSLAIAWTCSAKGCC